MPTFERLDYMLLWGVLEKYIPQLKDYGFEQRRAMHEVLNDILEANM